MKIILLILGTLGFFFGLWAAFIEPTIGTKIGPVTISIIIFISCLLMFLSCIPTNKETKV